MPFLSADAVFIARLVWCMQTRLRGTAIVAVLRVDNDIQVKPWSEERWGGYVEKCALLRQ